MEKVGKLSDIYCNNAAGITFAALKAVERKHSVLYHKMCLISLILENERLLH